MLNESKRLLRLFLVLLVFGISVWAWSLEFEQEGLVDTSSAIETGEYGWRVAVPNHVRFPLQGSTDTNQFPTRSKLTVAEDGIPLGPPHQIHTEVMQQGHGRFSHWGGWLYFSASDNTNPKENGRAYSVSFTYGIHKSLIILLAGIAIGLIIVSETLLRFSKVRRDAAVRGIPARYLFERRLMTSFGRQYVSDRDFWIVFGMLLAGGIAMRGYWAWALGLPYVVPDSMSYVAPALANPLLPFNEARTAGVPYLTVIGMGIAGHPMGLIAIYNLLWLCSTVAIIYTAKKVMGLRLLALLFMAYLCFVQKNLALEFSILSEHAASAIYMLTVSVMLLTLRRPSLSAGLAVGLLTVFNIMVKPSAMAFLPVIPIWYAMLWYFNRDRVPVIIKSFAISIIVIATLMGGYMKAFENRYGSFTISHFDGFNFFAQNAHLTVLDGGIYPKIKEDMATFLPLYVKKYTDFHRYAWNWVIYSSANPEMKEDFGEQSPVRSILKFQGNQNMGPTNKVMKELAIEGVKANPLGYLNTSVYILGSLMIGGYNFSYGNFMTEDSLPYHRSQANELKRWFFEKEGWTDTPLRQRIRSGLERHPGGIPEGTMPAGFNSASTIVGWMTHFLGMLAWVAFGAAVPLFVIVVLVSVPAIVRRRFSFRGETVRIVGSIWALPAKPLAATVLIGLAVLGYCTAVSFYCVSDPTRFLANVQNLYLLTFLGIISLAVRPVRRALTLLARRDRRA